MLQVFPLSYERRLLELYFTLQGTSINPLKPRWRRWKYTQNAHVLRVHCAFSPISALPSRLDRIYRGALHAKSVASPFLGAI